MKKELDDVKSQLVIAEYNKEKDLEENNRKNYEEIQTLQQIIQVHKIYKNSLYIIYMSNPFSKYWIFQETVDEASKSIHDIKRLTEENERLRQEIHEIKEIQQTQVS